MSMEEERLRALDEEPEDQWLVPPWQEIREADRMTAQEWALLRGIIQRRNPKLLPRLDIIGVRIQRPGERERVRSALVDEFIEFGLQESGEPNEYGIAVDELIGRLGRI